MFRTVLVPLDGSRFAETALPLAERLARSSRAQLHLVLAHEPAEALIGMGDMVLPPTNFYEEQKARGRSYLGKIARRTYADESEATSAEFHEVEGPAGPAICEEAARLNADLVIMATHGRGPFRRLWLGSVADYVIRHLAAPVLLVRPAGAEAPSQARPIRGILVALDLSSDSERILEPVAELAKLTGAELTLLHVAELLFEIGRTAMPEPVLQDAELLERARLEAEARLEALARKLRLRGLKVSSRVVVGSTAASGVLDALDEERFDLVAMTTHGTGGMRRMLLGSVADKVIRAARKPVLVLRPPPAVG